MVYLILFIAVAFGYLAALVFKRTKINDLSLFLSFSGAFLLAMTILELLPEVFELPTERIGLFIMSGILLQICLEFFSKGAEHGHVHLSAEKRVFPWLLFFSLSVHALLEGIPVSDGNNILIGILVHKIPVAIILSLFFIKANYKISTTLIFMTLFALMTPIGTWLSEEIISIQNYEREITAVVIGMFLHVSTTILYESSRDHKFNLTKLIVIILGFGIAYFL
ncbi:ZIP family metal transporter [Candidatus Ulvibacter alkanivorans]|uniref:ZIP family metal transporter n=1 Tax=Candidatus Ulvibacter alkanivorans TaxID=2267620 RepID=UPI000DF37165|nr:ZIP family metal transporter [Candidatus Ulvibacter alkanivorans]